MGFEFQRVCQSFAGHSHADKARLNRLPSMFVRDRTWARFRYFLLASFRLLSIPTIIPDGESFLFNLAAAAINFFTPGLFTSAIFRSLTFRTNLALPSSSFSGSGRAA